MVIRRADINDIKGINKLLRQVLDIHHNGRPDIFKNNCKKYTDQELSQILSDDMRPVFAAVEDGNILGYAFCVVQQHIDDNILTDIKTLYIDDLCVDQDARGKHIGKTIYDYLVSYAKENGFYNITLNVWACNTDAIRFYEKCGLVPQKIGMEKIL